MPSRVLLLSLHYPPEPTGNAPYVGALAAGLSARGLAVLAQTGHPHYPEWRVRPGYGQWTRVEHIDGATVARRRHYVPRPPRGLRRLLSELSFGLRLTFARWGRPEIIVAVSPALFATALAVLRARLTPRRPPLAVWVQDIYSLGLRETGEGSGIVARVTRWVESLTLRAADRVVVVHQSFADTVVELLGVDPTRVVIIRNWTHLAPAELVEPSRARRALGWPADVALAVHTGNMGAKQGLENVVNAARLADERGASVRFVLVGDGGERAALEAQAVGVSRIDFIDPLDDASYRNALAAADVLVVNERLGVSSMAVPSKLTSYFDAGRPIVAATAPDGITASEIGASGAGVVVPADDPGALLDAVLTVAADREQARLLGAAGRSYRESNLSEDAAISAFVNLINELAGKPERSEASSSR